MCEHVWIAHLWYHFIRYSRCRIIRVVDHFQPSGPSFSPCSPSYFTPTNHYVCFRKTSSQQQCCAQKKKRIFLTIPIKGRQSCNKVTSMCTESYCQGIASLNPDDVTAIHSKRHRSKPGCAIWVGEKTSENICMQRMTDWTFLKCNTLYKYKYHSHRCCTENGPPSKYLLRVIH